MGYSCEWSKGEPPSSIEDGTVIRCKSQNHVPIVAVSEEPRFPDDPSKASGDRLQMPGADHQETSREKLLNLMSQARRTQPSIGDGGLSGELSHSHNVVVEQPAVEPEEKTLDERRVNSKEESTDLPVSAERSKRPNTSKPIGRHKVCTHFPTDPKCEICNHAFSERSEL